MDGMIYVAIASLSLAGFCFIFTFLEIMLG